MNRLANLRKIPLFIFHGTEDETLDFKWAKITYEMFK